MLITDKSNSFSKFIVKKCLLNRKKESVSGINVFYLTGINIKQMSN